MKLKPVTEKRGLWIYGKARMHLKKSNPDFDSFQSLMVRWNSYCVPPIPHGRLARITRHAWKKREQ